MKKTTVRIESELINAVREKFIELKDLSDTDIIRVALRKLIIKNHWGN